jgi:2',3'-cyclic-nucleotide 2'-phosphodiesterase / 3'-nucleotidase
MLKLPRSLALLPLAALLMAHTPAAPASATLDVTILGTTDVHGHVYPTNYYGDAGDEPVGLARIHTLVKQLRAKHPHTMLVDSGDCLQGTPLTYHNARIDTKPMNPMVQAMNFMGYDAFAVGNHEYNYGIPYLMKARHEAKYPFLSGNIFEHKTEKPVFKPYIIKNVGGAKIAVLGFTTPGVAVWDRRHVQGKQDFRDIVASAKRWLPEVKAQGADAIVVIIHSGLGAPYDGTFGGYSASEGLPEENVCAKLAETFPEIDAILLGHSHKDLPKLLHNGVLLTQAKKWGERLAVVDLKLSRQGGRWKVVTKDSRTLDTSKVTPDPEVLAVARKAHQATLAYVNSVIGTSTGEWSAARARTQDTPIMDLINEVQRAKTGAQLSAASVFNGSAKLPKGRLTVSDIAGLYVYENTLTKIELTGKQLKDYLETSARYFKPYQPGAPIFDETIPAYNYDMVSGVSYAIDVTKPQGSRIVGLTYQGELVADGQKFTMALNSYRQNGGGGFSMLREAPVQENYFTEIRELMIDYVKDAKVLSPEKVHESNWRILPEGVVAEDGLHYR